ncbi:MFS transporter [Candidatus Bathycorpusculum sp.]|jgi:MFS family permease|uniref:MFS transporter n=1 Tax=Candidatus Bathycorpusculum sp. TaxID=2994959 RepID=UPI00282D36EE|nr:MFS transporter [Candidatus Termitimicrobium sp.]MCL2431268.1 MFS transporter [Candidatus Termitimicrobium sp.]
MWRLGFFFHEMAFGLLSVFIPLYLVAFNDTSVLGGPLVALGIMTSIAVFASIPASYIWGYLCDKTRRYKTFILLSFASSAIMLFMMTLPFAQNILVFVALYVVMQVLHISHEAPKNVLVAENYSRNEWEKSYGLYEGFTEIGYFIGLGIGLVFTGGLFAFAALGPTILATYTLYLCSALSVVAFALSVTLVADPMIIFERRLVNIERKLDFAYRGMQAYGMRRPRLPKQESFGGFAIALVMFSLATSIFFTPLPIFLSDIVSQYHILGLTSTSFVYFAYLLNSLGAMAGYFFIRNRALSMDLRKQLPRFVLIRSLLIFGLVGAVQFIIAPNIITGLILVLLGFAYGVYHIMMLSLSMELIPQGKSGLFDSLIGLGTGIGSFLGPFLASNLNYMPTFIIAATIFLLAFIILKFVAIRT